ncbi:MAG TPA: sugar ABC transporter permease [Solirubrobacteraceae bacterium]|nr:sugar ABC transporter permease [Solirubrobacteraceae bacterium]
MATASAGAGVAPAAARTRSARPGRHSFRLALPWLAPLLTVATAFYLWPTIQAIRLSFTNATLLRDDAQYTLETYGQTLSDPTLGSVLRITAIFVAGSIIGQLVLGLAIALLVQRAVARRLRGAVVVRTIVLCAWVMPGILIGVVWQIVLNEGPYGLVNLFLSTLGLDPVAFLSKPDLALGSVTVANIWRGTAFSMLLLYAGLQTVNRELYEAAAVDGASRVRQFWHVTLPQLRPVLLVNVVLITIATLNTFDMILPLTGGGPAQATEVLALHVYNTVFINFNIASGSVFAVFLLLIGLGLTAIYRRLLRAEAL